MVAIEDKGKKESFDKSQELNGVKPFGTIGADRDADRSKSKSSDPLANIASKLKRNKRDKGRLPYDTDLLKGSTEESGQKANGFAKVANAVKEYSNRR